MDSLFYNIHLDEYGMPSLVDRVDLNYDTVGKSYRARHCSWLKQHGTYLTATYTAIYIVESSQV